MTRILLNTKRTWLMLVVLLGVSFQNAFAQVNTYLFTTTTGNTYTPITGGTVLGTATNDDQSFGGGTGAAFPIGFPFTYNGIICNNFAVNSNGFITVGATATVPIGSSYTAISNASTFAPTNNAIVGYNADLQGTAGTGELSYLSSGTTGSRELVVQWKNYGHFFGPVGNLNFQIVLRETGNAVLINYGSFSGLDAENPQVGLRGSSNTNFNNRTTTTDWALTTAGTTNTAGCISNATIFPPTGTTFRWGLTPACTGAAFTTALLPSGVVGATYNETIVATGGVTPYTFSIVSGSLPAGLSIDATTGVISGSPTTANITPPIFTVGILDGAACPSSRDYSIIVTGLPCITINIAPITVPAATVGVLYAPIFFVASGVPTTASYSYSLVSGILPSGMTLTASGINAGRLTGTPSNSPSFPAPTSITIRARVTTGAYAGCFGIIVIDLVVNCPPITVLPATLSNAVIDSGVYSQQINASGGGTGTGTGTFTFEPDSTNTPTDRDWEGFSIVGKNLEMVTTRLMAPKTIKIKVKRVSSNCFITQSYTLGVVPKIAAPTQIDPMQISSSSFRARWLPVDRAVRYRVYVATSEGFDGGSFAIGYVGLAVEGDTSILVQNLKPDTKYYIQVTAISSAAEVSPYSNIKNVTTLSAVTSIDNALSSQVKVSPNPSNNKFLVDFGTLNLGKTTTRVYDAQGKQVLSTETSANTSGNTNQTTISLGNMANGIYLLEIISNKGRILKRLIKE